MPAGRKPAHSREEFVDAALEIADDHGVAALSIREIARSTGVTAATIYAYFRDKDDLVTSVRQKLLVELAAEIPESGPKEKLLALGVAFRSQARAHPCLAEFTAMPSPGGAMSALNVFVLDQLRQLGLKGPQLLRSFRQLESFVVGASLFDFSGAPGHLTGRLERMQELDDSEVSNMLATVEDIDADNEAAFAATLSLILDHLDRQAK